MRTAVSNDRIIGFIAAILERYRRRSNPRCGKRGALVVLMSLDGSAGKAIARKLCSLVAEQERFDRIRYFSWPIPLCRGAGFPLPEFNRSFRRPEVQGHLPNSRFTIVQICRSLLLANLVHWLRVRPLLRRNSLVLVDGYDYNCFLHSASAPSSRLAGLLARRLSFYPQPDLVVTLKTSSPGLSACSVGLSEAELLRQQAVLEQLHFDAGRVLHVDAASPPSESAHAILKELAASAPRSWHPTSGSSSGV